jgi:hypothetical protein
LHQISWMVTSRSVTTFSPPPLSLFFTDLAIPSPPNPMMSFLNGLEVSLVHRFHP